MKNCIYFASEAGNPPGMPRLALGFGFDRAGNWRQGRCAGAEALVVDDRYPPGAAGLREAIGFLRAWTGWILWDFEGAPTRPLLELIGQVGAAEGVVPPAWTAAPHSAVLAGPYAPGVSFRRWLQESRARIGAVVLDAAPIRHFCAPGGRPRLWDAPLPEAGLPCPGAGCLYGRIDGGFLYWDSRETLTQRCRDAGVPAIVLAREWAETPAGAEPDGP